ncbi:hypothetical protein Rhe02_91090 [Rhizocola hellebori]|uniref:Peptidoglycan binding-like domain-containing protein n=1 Tax=Rhizocola hellebori TaxID=1392758 RepID=A0A8J3QJ76_9ACTN|nr:peptidoglycan-binding domain-containing protein [Rhizocola hellebori]GIH11042.1 hypothetical protein Rhe02_91090 [Rhizocola hellebori]
MQKHRFLRRIGLRVLVAGSLILPVTMASGTAHAGSTDGLSGLYGSTFVDGAGVLTDDWGDHFSELGNALCNGCGDSMNSDLVVMWQGLLYTEGFLTDEGVDGDFGPNTANATKAWQTRYGLTADGRVGASTWARADDKLYWVHGTRTWWIEYYSTATGRTMVFHRGDYDVQDGGAYSLYSVEFPSGGEWAFFPQWSKVGFSGNKLSISPVPCLDC